MRSPERADSGLAILRNHGPREDLQESPRSSSIKMSTQVLSFMVMVNHILEWYKKQSFNEKPINELSVFHFS